MHTSADTAIADLYAAILSPAGWSRALQELARSVDSVGLVVFPPYASGISRTFLQLPASPDLREPMAAFVDEGWALQDHRAMRARRLLSRGREVIYEHDVASDEDRKTIPVYHEFYRRFDMPWFAAALFEADDTVWSATFLRSESQGPFGDAEHPLLLALRTHLQRAVSLSVRTTALLGGAKIDLLDALDLLSTGRAWSSMPTAMRGRSSGRASMWSPAGWSPAIPPPTRLSRGWSNGPPHRSSRPRQPGP